MTWESIPLGPIQTNCYVLYDGEGSAVVFDPGGDGNVLLEKIQSLKAQPLAVLLTHAHFDHIGAVDTLRHSYDIPVYLHEEEREWLMDPSKNGSSLFPVGGSVTAEAADHLIYGEGPLTIGPFTFQVLETPGHSPGSVSFLHETSRTVFSGDILFAGGIGRTDLPGGDQNVLMRTIHHKMLELPEDTYVACGHGPWTTIGREMDDNPFLHGF
ncbi:MBL fold metallo-hydrolase [Salibacterium sp. K-3]